VVVLGGCGQGRRPEVGEKWAQATFALRCAPCHGATGRGDGAEGASLAPRPRDLTDRGWQAGATDAQIGRVIVSGGPAIGRSGRMPGAPDLMNRPEEVAALVRYIRGLR
jgi:mono/diheme cytochrome c family protein